MDDNKKKTLKNMQYTIKGCCGLCTHGDFPQNMWGTCKLHEYKHLKHIGEERKLSIHKYGTCSKFEMSSTETARLSGFQEFFTSK